ncbi:MAG: hypothetical protein JWN38_546 [Candidatus Saccharibacteria bacterium]|nr:hypothetical protein [Candidatus Saccharibacteria bacterium]
MATNNGKNLPATKDIGAPSESKISRHLVVLLPLLVALTFSVSYMRMVDQTPSGSSNAVSSDKTNTKPTKATTLQPVQKPSTPTLSPDVQTSSTVPPTVDPTDTAAVVNNSTSSTEASGQTQGATGLQNSDVDTTNNSLQQAVTGILDPLGLDKLLIKLPQASKK